MALRPLSKQYFVCNSSKMNEKSTSSLILEAYYRLAQQYRRLPCMDLNEGFLDLKSLGHHLHN